MSETTIKIPVSELIPILSAISDRNWKRFKDLEINFASLHGVEVWEDVFNFRVLPALDSLAKKWLLVQKCSRGIKSVKVVE